MIGHKGIINNLRGEGLCRELALTSSAKIPSLMFAEPLKKLVDFQNDINQKTTKGMVVF
ncbi:hypothetical protein GCM10008018_34180 [Paenibacillus marchantiophytorum]|uniref:Uncharacterized protein n=1 Tax=Paenibacillus marchantiophytorum TaxID=1619310 RepID=A0ABQ1ETK0_9BACL|nr:hypothetical protein GCM10008018_34180 [Paenibacillus marchantiophytorum]